MPVELRVLDRPVSRIGLLSLLDGVEDQIKLLALPQEDFLWRAVEQPDERLHSRLADEEHVPELPLGRAVGVREAITFALSIHDPELRRSREPCRPFVTDTTSHVTIRGDEAWEQMLL